MSWFAPDGPNIRNLQSDMTKCVAEPTLGVVWPAQKCEGNPGREVGKDGESMADRIMNKWTDEQDR